MSPSCRTKRNYGENVERSGKTMDYRQLGGAGLKSSASAVRASA